MEGDGSCNKERWRGWKRAGMMCLPSLGQGCRTAAQRKAREACRNRGEHQGVSGGSTLNHEVWLWEKYSGYFFKDLRESPMCSKVWEALLWRPALNHADWLRLGGYAHPLARHSGLAQSSWQPANEWLAQGTEGWPPGLKVGLGRGSGWHCPLAEVIASHLTPSLPYPAPQSLSRAQLFVTPMDCSPPGSSVHELEWLVTPFSRGSSRPRDRTQVSRVAGSFVTVWTTREAPHRCLPPESIHLASCPRLKLPWGSVLGSLTPDPPGLPLSTMTLSVDLPVARVVLIKFPARGCMDPRYYLQRMPCPRIGRMWRTGALSEKDWGDTVTLWCETGTSEGPVTHVTPREHLPSTPLWRTVYSQPEPSSTPSLHCLSLGKHIEDPQMIFLNSFWWISLYWDCSFIQACQK